MSIRQRRKNADYIKVGSGFEFMGTGFTQLDDEPSASTTSKRYINMSGEIQSITGYAWSAPFTFDQIDSEKAIAAIVKIGKEELTGADAETEYVSVDLNGTSGVSGYPARKRSVAIEVSSFDDSDGEIEGSGNLLAKGEWVYGYFDTSTKTFTENDTAKEAFSYAVALSASGATGASGASS